MRFLVDASLPRSAAPMLRRNGHDSFDVRDEGLGTASDVAIAARARQAGLAIVTRDFDFADIRNYPPADYAGIIVLQLPDDATASSVVALLETLIQQDEILARLPSRLAVAEFGRVRIRPA